MLITCSISTGGQVIINEFSASNTFTVKDTETGEYSDWIELHNTGSSGFDLTGYYLTDNLGNPDKWAFPAGTSIEAGGFLIIWADDRNTGLHTGFKLSAEGEQLGLFSPKLWVMDSLSFGIQKSDISFGRSVSPEKTWGYFRKPTPGKPNDSEFFSGITYSVPEILTRGGFYEGPVQAEIFNDMGGVLRYTTNGTEPENDSPLYTGPVTVDSTLCLRARIFETGKVPGPVVTSTFFIHSGSAERTLPVVSIATDPDNFWDPVRGIYVQNFKPDWEVPINIEYFSKDGSNRAAFSQTAGAKINGLYSWQLPQKMLGIYFRGAYDAGNLDYPITPQRGRYSFKTFALRASGSDWSYTLFRDMLGQHSTMLNMDIEIMGFRPSVLYLNGQYMGIHNIREKVDADYIVKTFNLPEGSFDMVENENYAEAGDLLAYLELKKLLKEDLGIEKNYRAVEELVDIENLTDYLITEMAVGNTSIDHNVMAWKPKEGGKWRWILMDLDRGFFNPSSNLIDFYRNREPLLLREMMGNPSWIKYFGKRLSAQLFTSFNPVRMAQLADSHAADIREELPYHIERWKGTSSSYGNPIPNMRYWEREVERLKMFTAARPAALVSDLRNYGFGIPYKVRVSVFPEEAGELFIDDLLIPFSPCEGPLPAEENFMLKAKSRPGYDFKYWAQLKPEKIIPAGSGWKYQENGELSGLDWTDIEFNDFSWPFGEAQFGYGDNDEKTPISKTSQFCRFRKAFTIPDSINKVSWVELRLLRDDGAIVWLNGEEVLRSNMPAEGHDASVLPLFQATGADENKYFSFKIDPEHFQTGINLLAVQIVREELTNPDMSFDLELIAHYPDHSAILGTREELQINLNSDIQLVAYYERNNMCLVPEIIAEDTWLSSDCSPYFAGRDVHILKNATLHIGQGVEIRFASGVSMVIEGTMIAEGSPDNPILFTALSSQEPWGSLIFRNTTGASSLNHAELRNAKTGKDPVNEKAAIALFNAKVNLDHLIIEDVKDNPILARYSEIQLKNSRLKSFVTGDLINVKYGKALIENCIFTGNDQPDTDAIDYDEVDKGIIRNSIIQGFTGPNSDAVDIGEKANDILIDSLLVYRVTDKGVSVGQRSTATISHSLFIACDMGVALKDSCRVNISHCVFYANNHAVAAYEKNFGHAGGNGNVVNSILSNSATSSILCDNKSKLSLSWCLSDDEWLSSGIGNLLSNPMFADPGAFNFGLLPGSPAIGAGMENGFPVNLGIPLFMKDTPPPLLITGFFINPAGGSEPEFIRLYNPSSIELNISEYSFSQGIEVVLPEGTSILPDETIYLTGEPYSPFWDGVKNKVIGWPTGKLANEGELLLLKEPSGIVADHLRYTNDGNWPSAGFMNSVFVLKDPGLDNHLAENWTTQSIGEVIRKEDPDSLGGLSAYPSPSIDMVYLSDPANPGGEVYIYRFTGHLAFILTLDQEGKTTFNAASAGTGIFIAKSLNSTCKIVIVPAP